MSPLSCGVQVSSSWLTLRIFQGFFQVLYFTLKYDIFFSVTCLSHLTIHLPFPPRQGTGEKLVLIFLTQRILAFLFTRKWMHGHCRKGEKWPDTGIFWVFPQTATYKGLAQGGSPGRHQELLERPYGRALGHCGVSLHSTMGLSCFPLVLMVWTRAPKRLAWAPATSIIKEALWLVTSTTMR